MPATPLTPPADDIVPLVPMRNLVLFPHVLMPIAVGRPRSLAAVRHAFEHQLPLGVVLQRDADRVALQGLPADARVVARGAAFLSDGDTVRVVADGPAAASPIRPPTRPASR